MAITQCDVRSCDKPDAVLLVVASVSGRLLP